METTSESVRVADGAFDLPVWLPPAGRGPGMLVLQEIFGVGPYIRSVAEQLSGLGYVVAAPDLLWRLQRNWEAEHDENGLQQSLGLASRFDTEKGVADTAAALGHLADLPEVCAGVGVIGFCFGGSLAYLLAARANPAAVVSFYGSAVPSRIDVLEEITCPLQFHFGGKGPIIPRDQVQKVEQAVEGRANVEIHVQENAGHAFHNHMAPMFYHPDAAGRAWQLTEWFLARHLPTSQ
jgi:carboxymethylenebutenolidase